MCEDRGCNKWNNDAGAAGKQRRSALTDQLVVIQLHSDEKEIQDQADGRKYFQEMQRTGREERCRSMGEMRPRTEGPSRIPPIISPMTRACPSLRASHPQTSVTARMTDICTRSRVIRPSILSSPGNF